MGSSRNSENVTLAARLRKYFQGFWVIFLLLSSIQKEAFQYTRIHSLLVNIVVTASSHANRDKYSNCDIYVTCVDVRSFL